MKRTTTLLSLVVFLLLSFWVQAQTKFKSLNYLYSIQGKQILSGQHNDQKDLGCGSSGATGASYWTDQVHNITGKYPALYSADLLFVGDGQARWDITYEAEKQWNAGAVVQMMWHSCPPVLGATCDWKPGIISSLTAAQFSELLTNGSTLNTIWKSRVDEIAVYLQYLKSKGVEVFWRPYHEQNQSVFWWNSQGAANTKALYKMMHDYMTNNLGLDNLVWILDVQDISGSTNYWDWNPGNQYWDIMALDVYSDAYTNSEYYNDLLTTAAGKPLAVGECFNLPSSQTINSYPQYTFFMNWAYGLKKGLLCENTNSDAFIQEVYNNPKVITRDEMPGWGSAPSDYVVGYFPTYNNFPNAINNMDLSVLTHINVAFLNPDANGNIAMPNGLATVVAAAHAKNVKVNLSICGGSGNANTYHTLLSNATLTGTFINNLVQACIHNNLDGVDVDIEGNVLDGTAVTPVQYENFVTKLGVALHAQNKMMTAALASWFANNVSNTAAQQFDFIGLMSYDAYGGWTGPGQHSSYQMAVNDFNNFHNNKGVAANKLLIGLPFYGYGWGVNQRAWSYADVVNAYPGAENLDQIGSGADVIYYNGIPTIQQKCTFAKQNAGGVMIWELTQDVTGSKSLLNAVGGVMGKKNANIVPDNLAKNKSVMVSSTDASALTAAAITDGFYNTRWSSAYSDNQWLYVDLGDEFNINRVKLTWESASAKNYVIQFSNDAQTFTTVKTLANNITLVNDFTALTGKARYVRISCSARTTVYGYSLYELEVYGTAIPKPYSGTAMVLPGTVQAEDYDLGGEGVTYHDLSSGNQYAQYRNDNVDIETCTDAGGGYNIGSAQMGEWLAYTVNVTQSGYYDIAARVATNQSGRTFHLEMNGQNISGAVSVPNTGAWQTYATVLIPQVQLQAGVQQLQLNYDSEYLNVNHITFSLPTITTVRENQITDIHLFPNPVSDVLNYSISSDLNKSYSLQILNCLGEVVNTESISTSSGPINLQGMSAGVYQFKFINDNSVFVKAVVVR